MVLTTMVAGVLLAVPSSEPWTLKAGIEPKARAAWAVVIDVDTDDGNHQAEFTYVREIGDPDGDNHEARCLWEKLLVDGAEMGDPPGWDVSVGPRGAIVGTNDMMGDDIRRMLSPMTFVYPDKAVAEGDKWEGQVRPYKDKDDLLLIYTYEVLGFEKVGDAEAIKVASKLTEKGRDAMGAEGTWWLGKDGALLKFSVKVTNWVVPMAGGEPMNARITGTKAG